MHPSKSFVNDLGKNGRLFLAAAFFAASIFWSIMLNGSVGPHPFEFMSNGAYMILTFLYLVGTIFPAILATFFHIEEFPVGPGGKLTKAVNYLILFVLSYTMSYTVFGFIRYITSISAGDKLYTVLNVLQPAYFLLLFCSFSMGIFNIRLRKTFIAVVPFIFTYLIFYFEIYIVHKAFTKGYVYYKTAKPVEILLLAVLALIPLLVFLLRQLGGSGIDRLVNEAEFHKVPEPDEIAPGEAFEQAMLMLNLGKKEKALEYLDKSLEMASPRSQMFLERGKLYIELEKYEKAAVDLEAYLERKKVGISEEPYLLLMQAYAEMGEDDNVLDVSEELLDKFPTNMQGLYYNIMALDKLGELKSQKEKLSKVKEMWKEIPDYLKKTEKTWYEKILKILED